MSNRGCMNKIITVLAVFCAAFICNAQDIIQSKLFCNKIDMFVSGYNGTTELADFPVLVRLSEAGIPGFSYSDCYEGGADIRFIDSEGNLIPHEIELWDTTGTSFVWVKIPAVSGKTTKFSMCYKLVSSLAIDFIPEVNSQDVWSKYIAVFHGNTSVTNPVDATGNSSRVVPNGVSQSQTNPLVGANLFKDAKNTRGLEFSNPIKNKLTTVTEGFTFSGWFNRKKFETSIPTIVILCNKSDWKNAGLMALVEKGTYFSVAGKQVHQPAEDNGKGALTVGEWGHLAFSYADTSVKSYFNSENIYSNDAAIKLADGNLDYWAVGSYANASNNDGYYGNMDEVRFYKGVASQDWLTAEYDSVNNSNFVTYSDICELEKESYYIYPSSFIIDGKAEFGALVEVCDENIENFTLKAIYGASENEQTEVLLGSIRSGYISKTIAFYNPGEYSLSFVVSFFVNGDEQVKTISMPSFNISPVDFSQGYYKAFHATISYKNEAAKNIPTLLRISEESISGFKYADVVDKKFEIIDSNGTKLPYEIEVWDEEGESLIWVNVPNFDDDEILTIRYGSSFELLDSTAVWAEYAGVWHFNETNNASIYGSYPNSTAAKGIDGELAAVSVAGEPGVFGDSVLIGNNVGGNNEAHRYGGVFMPDSGENSPLDVGSTFAISGWFKHSGKPLYYDNMFYKRTRSKNDEGFTGGFAIELRDTREQVDVRGNSNTYTSLPFKYSIKDWSYITFVYNGSKAYVYQNGQYLGSTGIASVINNDSPLCVGNCELGRGEGKGNRNWNGWVDEVRLIPGEISAAFVQAEYAAMADENLITYSDVMRIVGENVIIIR